MQVNIEIPGNIFEVESKKKSLEKLKNLDPDSLQKLADLSENKKAIEYLKNPPTVVKITLGIK